MIITDLTYLENLSGVSDALEGGQALANGSAFALANSQSGQALTYTMIKTFANSTPYISIGSAIGAAVSISFNRPSLPS